MFRKAPAPFTTWGEYREARDAFYKSPGWLAIREQVIAKSDGRCVYCKCVPTHKNPINIDHKVPLCKRWDRRLDITNLQVTCHRCNEMKSGSTHKQFSRLMRTPEYLQGLAMKAKGKRKRRLLKEIKRRTGKNFIC